MRREQQRLEMVLIAEELADLVVIKVGFEKGAEVDCQVI